MKIKPDETKSNSSNACGNENENIQPIEDPVDDTSSEKNLDEEKKEVQTTSLESKEKNEENLKQDKSSMDHITDNQKTQNGSSAKSELQNKPPVHESVDDTPSEKKQDEEKKDVEISEDNVSDKSSTDNQETENGSTAKLVIGKIEQKEVLEKEKKYFALECEMIAISGTDGRQRDMLAKATIVDENGEVVYEEYVKPECEVLDYRTELNGLEHIHLENGKALRLVQAQVKSLLEDHILVGHSLKRDFKVLSWKHDSKYVRDTAKFIPLHKNSRICSLRELAKEELDLIISMSHQRSKTRAIAAMKLYMKYKEKIEEMKEKGNKRKVKEESNAEE